MLAVFQLSLNRIDWLSLTAIDAVFGGSPERVIGPATFILGLALLAFVCPRGQPLVSSSTPGATPNTSCARCCSAAAQARPLVLPRMTAGEIMSRSRTTWCRCGCCSASACST